MAQFYTDDGHLTFNLTYDVPFKFMFAQQGQQGHSKTATMTKYNFRYAR